MEQRIWYQLDNAANIYPVIQTRTWTSMFRITAVMKERVDVPALQRALNHMRKRFPSFHVCLKSGMFWHYLEQLDRQPLVEADTLYPCHRPQQGELPYRVKVHESRISAEFSHIVCDGGGGAAFFKTLLCQYLRERGLDVPHGDGILNINDEPVLEEYEDGFKRFSRMGARPGRIDPRAYRIKGTHLHPGMRMITTGTLSVSRALQLARSHDVSLTEYITATLIYVIYNLQKAERAGRLAPVKVSVPVNLRKYYPTKTLRNFSQYLTPGIDPNLGDFSFEETLDQVHHYFRFMYTEKNLNARISQNVGDENNVALRLVPLFLKKLGIRIVFETSGENAYSSVISNLGPMDLPDVVSEHVERFDFILCTARRNAVECGMVSYGDTLSITFTRSISEPYVERMFFRALVQRGLHVLVESNQNID